MKAHPEFATTIAFFLSNRESDRRFDSRKAILFVLILCGLFYFSGFSYAQHKDTSEIVDLNKGWSFSQSGTDSWLPAIVPGTVHQDLIRQKLLPDPFYGTNEQKVQWVENEDWEYKTTFFVTKEQLIRDAVQLTFEGLDTYVDVYLNGALILNAVNMFTGYTVPVKQMLRIGENRLQLHFYSPVKRVLPQWESNGFNYPADNDHHEKRLSVFTRKAPFSYGWDWGIRLATCGIWRPVRLKFYDMAKIEDFHVRQLSLDDRAAILSGELEIINILSEEASAELVVSYALAGEEPVRVSRSMTLKPGMNRMQLPVEVRNPVRWMPNGWGKPVLYDFRAQVKCNDQVVAEKHHRIGLRTVRLVIEKDNDGESFYFEVNGAPLFAKGANYIPQDALLPAVTEERYQTLFRDIKDANMNMVRVWGGGVYEDDPFYDLADENGILVWQDFMFACTSYPGDPSFLRNVETEAEYTIRRLRNHACLAMWCGNNEIAEGLKYWGWQKQFTKEVYEDMLNSYDKLFNGLLAEKVKALDADRFYMHSSPYFANWGHPESWGIGDSHNWGVWYGRKPFESLDTEVPRFMSEFGFQSFPEMKTIAAFAAPQDYQVESEVMNAHQKSSIGNALIRTYMEREYVLPEKFEDFVYLSLVLQGHGIGYGIEAHRRNRPYCMGSLYWQLNDSWPVVSWSGIDYFGNWKALHYQAKRAFEPLLINPVQQGDSLAVYLVSDKLEDLGDLTLEMQLIDFDGKLLSRQEVKPVNLPGNTSLCVYSEKTASVASPERRKHAVLQLILKDRSGKETAEKIYFFSRTKELELPQTSVVCKVKQYDGYCDVTLSSPKLAKDVFIEIPLQGARFSDNFFDLLPGQTKKVRISSRLLKKEERADITIKHIRGIYN